MVSTTQLLAGAATIASAVATIPQVRNEGVPVGQLKNISGIETYISHPPNSTTPAKAIIHITDIFGVPLLENKLLADSLAAENFLVVVPDLFAGDAISVEEQEAGLNLTEWLTQHPPTEIDRIIKSTLDYVKGELGYERVGGVGYCFGGKYVPRWLTGDGTGIDIGFIAHPSNLNEGEIGGVKNGLSIAAGSLDRSFNSSAKAKAESILLGNNVTFQSTLYSGAPHGFAVRINESIPQQAYAKQASFVQAITWFDAWL